MLEELKQAIIDGDTEDAVEEINGCIGSIAPLEIVQKGLIPAMDEVAALWKDGEYFMSDVILSANAFSAAMDTIAPELEKSGMESKGKIVLGVVEGDNHDLGKNIVVAMLKANGYQVIDLGINQPLQNFIDAVKEEKPDILGIGAYMSTTMAEAEEIINALKAEGLRDDLKILIGGVCITQEVVDRYGADGWGRDAMMTVSESDRVLSKAGVC